MMLACLLTLVPAALADPGATPEPGPPEQESPSPTGDFGQVAANAKRLYIEGEHLDALNLFQALYLRLLNGEEPPWDIAADTLIFYGEVQYQLGEQDAAALIFRWLLERDPTYPISPYHHPLEVVGWFETIRRAVLEEIANRPQVEAEPPPAEVPPALPIAGYLPFGVPQFAQKRPVAGLIFGALQLGFGASSMLKYAQLNRVNAVPPDGELHPLGWPSEEIADRVDRQRLLLQIPLVLAFYGSWLGSHVEARSAWRRQVVVQVGPTPGAASGSGRPTGGLHLGLRVGLGGPGGPGPD
jgi:hypothetical protein